MQTQNRQNCADIDTRGPWLSLVVAGLLLLGSPAAAEDLMIGDYDPRNHVGRLVAPGPNGQPVVVASQEGRYPSELVDVTVGGRRGHLVLWKGSPRDPSVYPELWVLTEEDQLKRLWPADPDFAWVDPEIVFHVEDEAPHHEYLLIRRELPGSRPDEASTWTRERLHLHAEGVSLAAKEVEPWESERQLLRLAQDFLLAGQADEIPALLERHRQQGRELSSAALRRLTDMSLRHASGVGVEVPTMPGFEGLGEDS